MEDALKHTQDFLNPAALLGHLQITPGMWVGDFGVGAGGHFVLPIAAVTGAEGGVVMFDVVKSALSGAMSRAKLGGVGNYRAVWTNLEMYEGAPGVADKSLDAGVLINVLHQSKKIPDMLAEIARMLKSQAKLLIVDWQPDARSSIAPPKDRRMSLEYVTDVAQQADLHAVESFSASPYHWGLIVQKA